MSFYRFNWGINWPICAASRKVVSFAVPSNQREMFETTTQRNEDPMYTSVQKIIIFLKKWEIKIKPSNYANYWLVGDVQLPQHPSSCHRRSGYFLLFPARRTSMESTPTSSAHDLPLRSSKPEEESGRNEPSLEAGATMPPGGGGRYKLMSPAKLPISRSSGMTITPGLSPTSFLESPVLLSNVKVVSRLELHELLFCCFQVQLLGKMGGPCSVWCQRNSRNWGTVLSLGSLYSEVKLPSFLLERSLPFHFLNRKNQTFHILNSRIRALPGSMKKFENRVHPVSFIRWPSLILSGFCEFSVT